MAREPQILGVHLSGYSGDGNMHVVITLKQLRKLPQWVYDQHLHWEYSVDNNKHCSVIMTAKDELEAAMRFKKLWAALTKLGD